MIHVPDVRQTAAWYESIGFTVSGVNEEDGGLNWARVSLDGSDVMFNEGGRSSAAERREVDLYVMVNDVDVMFERLNGRSEIVDGVHHTFYGMREFTIRDINRFWITFGQPSKSVQVSP